MGYHRQKNCCSHFKLTVTATSQQLPDNYIIKMGISPLYLYHMCSLSHKPRFYPHRFCPDIYPSYGQERTGEDRRESDNSCGYVTYLNQVSELVLLLLLLHLCHVFTPHIH